MNTEIDTTVNFIKLENNSSEKNTEDFHKTFKLNKTKLESLMFNLVHKNADPTFFFSVGKPAFEVTPAIVAADNSKKHLYKFFKKIRLYNIARVTHDADHFKYYMKDAVGLVYEFVINKKEKPLDALSKALFSFYDFSTSPSYDTIYSVLKNAKNIQELRNTTRLQMNSGEMQELKDAFIGQRDKDIQELKAAQNHLKEVEAPSEETERMVYSNPELDSVKPEQSE